ncbi:MAG: TonB-dependent receptor [Sphingomonadales bacterium]|nr:TonB-dependent receptor [Sphingomonadales bacterium]
MSIHTRLGLLMASASLLAATAAHADEAAEPRATIVVTATKKPLGEDAQTVPLAVNAFTADEIAATKVRAISDLTHAIPGVSLDQVGTFRGVANWSIRGLGINSSIASVDPAVGTFVDGVYVGINPGGSLDLFDLKQIEVLRGPQGTLYGRNVTGGAVLVETADPTSTFHVGLKGSFDGPVDSGRGAGNLTMQGVVSGPLADGLGIRVAGYHNSDGGYFRNLFNGGSLGKAETNALRGTLAYDRGGLRLLGKLEWLKTSGDGAVGQNHGRFARDTFDVSLDNEGFIRARAWSGSLRADLDMGGGTLTNVLGWRNFRQFTSNDIDSSPLFLFHSDTGLTQKQWSDELRWSGRVNDVLELTIGDYIFHQDVAYEENRRLPTVTAATFYGGGRQGQDVYGIFGQADWHVLPTLTLTGGLRWSQEDKNAAVTFVRTRPACSVVANTCPITGTNPLIAGDPNGFVDKHRWTSWSPKLALSWQPVEDVLAYAGWSRGNRSGGYNLRVTSPAAFLANAAVAGSPSYDAERVDSFEAGIKLSALAGRATLNLAAYRTEVKGMQREVSVASGGSGLAQSIYNTADARIQGFEAEASLRPGKGFTLAANVGHIDARYTRVFFDISGDNAVTAADLALALPRVPRWTWGLSAAHDVPLGGAMALTSRVAFQHRSRYAYTDSNFGWVGASDNLDADVTLRLPVKGFSLSLYGRNLLDEVQFGGDTQIPFGGTTLSDGNNRAFDPRPAAGTFSPLMKGRVIGIELAVEY